MMSSYEEACSYQQILVLTFFFFLISVYYQSSLLVSILFCAIFPISSFHLVRCTYRLIQRCRGERNTWILWPSKCHPGESNPPSDIRYLIFLPKSIFVFQVSAFADFYSVIFSVDTYIFLARYLGLLKIHLKVHRLRRVLKSKISSSKRR